MKKEQFWCFFNLFSFQANNVSECGFERSPFEQHRKNAKLKTNLMVVRE